MASVGAGLARLLRPLIAVLLMGTAMLVVALVGQGVAGARELPRDAGSGWQRPPAVPATAAGATFVRRWTAAQEALGRTRPAGSPDRSGDEPGKPPPPQWWLAGVPRPPAVKDRPAGATHRGDGELPPGTVVQAAGSAADGPDGPGPDEDDRAGRLPASAASRPGAGRVGPPAPTRLDLRARQALSAEAEALLTERAAIEELFALGAGSPALTERLNAVDARYFKAREHVSYPPEFDGHTTGQLRQRAEVLQSELDATKRSIGEPGRQPSPLGRTRQSVELYRQLDFLRRQYGYVGEALSARLVNVQARRVAGPPPERLAALEAEENEIQATVDKIKEEIPYPLHLQYAGYDDLQRLRSEPGSLREAIARNDLKLAELGNQESIDQPTIAAIAEENGRLRRQLEGLESFLRLRGGELEPELPGALRTPPPVPRTVPAPREGPGDPAPMPQHDTPSPGLPPVRPDTPGSWPLRLPQPGDLREARDGTLSTAYAPVQVQDAEDATTGPEGTVDTAERAADAAAAAAERAAAAAAAAVRPGPSGAPAGHPDGASEEGAPHDRQQDGLGSPEPPSTVLQAEDATPVDTGDTVLAANAWSDGIFSNDLSTWS
jgi:hypothetical protein